MKSGVSDKLWKHEASTIIFKKSSCVIQKRLLFDFGQAPRIPVDAPDHADLLKTLNAEKKFKQVITSFEKVIVISCE
jgi:hypothetical protein